MSRERTGYSANPGDLCPGDFDPPTQPVCHECGEPLYPQDDHCMGCGTEFEEAARNKASQAYHDHPANPSSCAAWADHTGSDYSQCPCENNWAHYMPKFD